MAQQRAARFSIGNECRGLEARVGFEPTNGGFADHSWFSILLVRLAFTPAYLADFSADLGPIVPKLFPSSGVNPYNETKSGHTCTLQSLPIETVSIQGFSPFVHSRVNSFRGKPAST